MPPSFCARPDASDCVAWLFAFIELQQNAVKSRTRTLPNLAPGLLILCIKAIDIGNAVATNSPLNPRGASEVRLPQELRFTDDRRFTIGNIPLARDRARPPKSSGRNQLHRSSRLLYSLRIPPAAFLFRSNL